MHDLEVTVCKNPSGGVGIYIDSNTRASDEHFALRIKMFGNVWSNKGIIFWQLSHYRHQNLIPQKSGVIFFHTNTFQKNYLRENMLKSTQNEFLI